MALNEQRFYCKPMHRTRSIDYAIVLQGKVILELEDGEHRELADGDVVVQRGTNHAWKNETDSWTRMYFVMIGQLSSESPRPLCCRLPADHFK